MRRLEAHDIVIVLGLRGSGKTHYVRNEIVARQGRVIVWDVHGEYPLRQVSLAEFLDPGFDLDAPDLRIAVRPEPGKPKQLGKQFDDFVQHIATARGLVLVVDEVGILTSAMESVVFIATNSRHWAIPVVFVAQRAVQIPVTAREQASHIVSFRQNRPEDIQALEERMGEKANQIKKLPRREFVEWDEEEDFETETERLTA